MSEYYKNLNPADKKLYDDRLSMIGVSDPEKFDPFLACKTWVDDLSKWPNIEFGQMYVYLVHSPGPYTRENMNTYRSLEAYNQYENGWVHTCFVKDINSVTVVKAKVNRSQAVTEKPHEAWVAIQRSDGTVTCGHCTCMSGMGGVCTHVAAVLFKVEACCRLGFNQVACTSVSCKWNQNFTKKVQAATVGDIDFRKPKRNRPLFEVQVNSLSQRTKFKDPTSFLAKLKESNNSAVIFSITEPKLTQIRGPSYPRTFDTFFKEEYASLSTENLVALCSRTFNEISVTKAQAEKLEQATRKQRKSAAWFLYRRGRLTTSNFHEIIHTDTVNLKSKSLLKNIMQYSAPSKNVATQWGIDHEAAALSAYVEKVSDLHTNFRKCDSGLVVNDSYPYLGATPDGMISCDCCGEGVVEVKCPYSMREKSPGESGDNGYLSKHTCELTVCPSSLKKMHRYYAQVQGQMMITNVKYCDFVCWTPFGIHIERIQLDTEFVDAMLPNLKDYFINIALPEILTQKVKSEAKSATDSPKVVAYCTCGKDESFDNMIGCDNDKCPIEWYHLKCVGLKSAPVGMWVCLKCRPSNKRKQKNNDSMSGRQFMETLRQLGYPKARSLDPQGFDWLFDNESIVPFLEWFCNNISASNVLNSKDLEEYGRLVTSDEGFLEGRQLEEALKTLTSAEDENITEEELRKIVDQTSADLKVYNHRKRMLIQKRNKLSLHHTGLTHRLSKLRSVEAKVNSKYRNRLQQCQAESSQDSLDALVKSVEEVNNLYHSDNTGTTPYFLSQLQLDEYIAQGEQFNQELTAFTKKQFFEGISQMAGQDEGSMYEILDISDPESLLIRGESEEVNLSQCKELARLQAFYPRAESKRIQALMDSKLTEECVRTAENILQSIQTGEFGKDIDKISESVQEKQHMMNLVTRDLSQMGENILPSLINESKLSRVSQVLSGDYNLKLSRQDYFVSNQDKVIHYLVEQRSRNEFLTMAFEVEAQNHRDTHRLLTAVQQHLTQQLKSWKERMTMMADPSFNPAKHQRGTVDSRDKFTTRLHEMLVDQDTRGEKQLFLTFNSLVEGAQRLEQQQIATKDKLLAAKTKQSNQLSSLEKNLQACQELVYAGSSTTSGQPCLTPRQLLDAMTQLDSMAKKLEQTIKEVVKDLETKKQVLKSDHFLQKERKIFTYFFTDVENLNKLFDDLSSRLQAQRVH